MRHRCPISRQAFINHFPFFHCWLVAGLSPAKKDPPTSLSILGHVHPFCIINKCTLTISLSLSPLFSGSCPLLCSGHGIYGAGRCHCDPKWKGVECDVPVDECEVLDCNGHGACKQGVCLCKPGWTGANCDKSEYIRIFRVSDNYIRRNIRVRAITRFNFPPVFVHIDFSSHSFFKQEGSFFWPV